MRGLLFYAHSGLRYVVLLTAVAAIAYLAFAIATKRPFDTVARRVAAAFTGALDLQILLGLGLLLQIPFYPSLSGHLVMMVAAAAVAHATAIVNKRRAPEAQSNGLLLAGVVVATILIVGGIMAIGRPLLGSS